MLNIIYLRELCEKAPPFVISAVAREALPELLDRVEKLEKVAEAGQRVVLDRTQFCDWDFDELDSALREAGYGG